MPPPPKTFRWPVEFKITTQGFTLAELLIALAILGVIATFTIPKILAAQQNGQAVAVTKEDIAAVNAAYSQYMSLNLVDTNTFTFELIQPYLNYVEQAQASENLQVDTYVNHTGSATCNTINYTCLKMHNGSVIYWPTNSLFSTQGCDGVGIRIYIDPDGTANATSVNDGTGKAALMCLHSNGRVTGPSNLLPSWFQW